MNLMLVAEQEAEIEVSENDSLERIADTIREGIYGDPQKFINGSGFNAIIKSEKPELRVFVGMIKK